jgi:hypothetical protein
MSTYATIGAKMTDISVVTKRDDPNYSQVSGYVPKDLARRFRIACTSQEISQSEALEEALEKWLEEEKSPATKKSKED